MQAPLGDDVLGDDPSVQELEKLGAEIFGKEAGLFCMSGTMGNQIAINVHTRPGDELICHEEAHIYRYEGGGIARNSGVSVRFLRGHEGRILAADLEDQLNPDDPHYPVTRLVCLEDTANRGGGVYYDPEEIRRISETCRELGLTLHLDGARVFNALAENGADPREYGRNFDSISICLSKGLGAPVGSLLIGSAAFIAAARRVRKVFGGGMRQAGIVASAGTFALRHNIERLKEDHARAKEIGKILKRCAWISEVLPVHTNIVVAHLREGLTEARAVEVLKSYNIGCVTFGKGRIRFVTHLDLDDEDIDYLDTHIPLEMN